MLLDPPEVVMLPVFAWLRRSDLRNSTQNNSQQSIASALVLLLAGVGIAFAVLRKKPEEKPKKKGKKSGGKPAKAVKAAKAKPEGDEDDD